MAGLITRSGQYYADFYDADRKPKRKRYSLGTTRKDVARRKLAKWERDYELGRLDPWVDDPQTYDQKPDGHTSIKVAHDKFMRHKEATGKARSTLKTYREVGRLFIRQVGRDTQLCQIRPEQIRTFFRDPSLAQATRNKRFRQLRVFIRWCVKEELLEKNPLDRIEKPQPPSKLPKAVTGDELRAICTALRADYEAKLASGEAAEGQMVWYIPLFQFAFCTGMRSSELGRLRWGDIDFDKRRIYIRKQKNKKEQTIPLNRRAAEILSGLEQGEDRDFVFHSPRMTAQERNIPSFVTSTARKFTRYRRKAGIDRQISFHGLRHGFCTMLAEAGKSAVIIKEAARHADISTSMRYVHMANERLKGELDDVFG